LHKRRNQSQLLSICIDTFVGTSGGIWREKLFSLTASNYNAHGLGL